MFRALCLATLVVVLGGCADETASGYLPKKTAAGAQVRHVIPGTAFVAVPKAAPIAAPAIELDIPAIVRDATRIPAQVRDLRRTIFWGALALCAVGLANAGILLALVMRSRPFVEAETHPIAAPALADDGERPATRNVVLASDLRVAADRYGYPAAPLVVAGSPLAYGAIPRQPGPVRDEAPRGERRRCACGELVAPRARARRCEACAKAARPRTKRPSTLAS